MESLEDGVDSLGHLRGEALAHRHEKPTTEAPSWAVAVLREQTEHRLH